MRLCNYAIMALAIAGAMMLTACGSGSGTAASQAVGGNDGTLASEQTSSLKLSHGLAGDHAARVQMVTWVEVVKGKSNGTISIQIPPSGQLGPEADNASSIQVGVLDMVKVPALALGNFNEAWNAPSVPYVFNDKDHYYKATDGEIVGELYSITEDDGFIGLTWLDSGSRPFYIANTLIRVPADLKGLKIRTMGSQITTDMMSTLGGSATAMSYPEIYTSLQQGVIDDAENDITALRGHSDATRYYCRDEYTCIPDVIVISTKIWNQISDSQKSITKETAATATDEYKTR